MYQDPVTGLRTFDIANNAGWPTASEARRRKALANREVLGENLRLLYVALTRAEHGTLLWWSRTRESDMTGLAHVLFARQRGDIDADLFSEYRALLPDDADSRSFLEEAFAGSGDAVAVSLTNPRHRRTEPWKGWAGAARAADDLELAVMGRPPRPEQAEVVVQRYQPPGGRRWLDPGDGLGDAGAADENADSPEPAAIVQDIDDGTGSDLPLGEVRGGTQFGTLVHEVLERVDFAAADLDDELRAHVEDRLRWNPWPVTAETLVAGLRATIETPLGPLFDGRRLRDLANGERLGELNFELRLGENGRAATDRDIGVLVLGHLGEDNRCGPGHSTSRPGCSTSSSPGISPARSTWWRASAGTRAGPRRGTTASSSSTTRRTCSARSALFRRRLTTVRASCRPRWLSTTTRYRHCSTRWRCTATCAERVRGYEPARHLGGVAYLFVRGMAGEATPVVDGSPYGVYRWESSARVR